MDTYLFTVIIHKSLFLDKRPAPGAYKVPLSDFSHKSNKGPTFGISYSSFEKVYMRANKTNMDKSIPGPGTYAIPEKKGVGYSMGAKLKNGSVMADSARNKIPGPGAYKTLTTITPRGDSILSTMR